ncbi:MAG: hypothetical protein C4293_15885, partial [Nitrospiraceae bacterium]
GPCVQSVAVKAGCVLTSCLKRGTRNDERSNHGSERTTEKACSQGGVHKGKQTNEGQIFVHRFAFFIDGERGLRRPFY